MLQRPAIDSCTTLTITGYYIHAFVTNTNGDVNERVYTSNYIDDMLGGIMGEFSVSYNDSFEQDLQPNANYIFVRIMYQKYQELIQGHLVVSIAYVRTYISTRKLWYISIQLYSD